MDYSSYPLNVVQDIVRLRRRIAVSGIPAKITDQNILIATWNIRAFGDIYTSWEENPGSPKRNYHGLAIIAEILRRFDIVAIQEVKRDLSGLLALLDWLGKDWGVIFTDVTVGDAGNSERLAFVFDRRRVVPTGLAGEIVLPPGPAGDPAMQFARTPYLVSFKSEAENFVLLTAHIKYGKVPEDRIPEIRSLADYIAVEILNRAKTASPEETNLIVLGDFNIDKRGDNPLFQAFRSTGLYVPGQLENVPSALGSEPKYYDQIAWLMDELHMNFTTAGAIDFSGAVFQEISRTSMTYRVSDHLPLWAEFSIDRSVEKLAKILNVNPSIADPFSVVPDRLPGD
jgi:endonuclease/exonuclease/phosphatase family metal-dependent hydrolase